MTRYRLNLIIECETAEEAVLVAAERTGFDEEVEDPRTGCDFPYTIEWSIPAGPQHDELRDACDIFYYTPDYTPEPT